MVKDAVRSGPSEGVTLRGKGDDEGAGTVKLRARVWPQIEYPPQLAGSTAPSIRVRVRVRVRTIF